MAVQAPQSSLEKSICLVGNPNTGKSVLFGILTGTYVTVSNYPGTTVEILKGSATLNGARQTIIDTPGTNSLTPMSEDERVTRDLLLDHPPGAVLQVGDAKNLKRVLAVTLQLAEMGVPAVLALNMSDEAYARGIHIDAHQLSVELGAPVVPTVAIQKTGVEALIKALGSPRAFTAETEFPELIERAVEKICPLLPQTSAQRGIALMALSGDPTIADWLRAKIPADDLATIEEIRAGTERAFLLPLSQIITRHRMHQVNRIYNKVTERTEGSEGPVAAWLGRVSMHPIWGLPFLAMTLFLTYKFVGVLGAGTLVDWVEGVLFNGYINPAARSAFAHVPFPIVRDLFVGEYGIITMAVTYGVAIVMPVVFTFFIAFSALEDSGYLPRLAVMVNDIFRAMGLNGKAVLPMVLGLGCDTMATLTTRVLETRRERTLVTLLLALGVPCSAQLAVVSALLEGNTRGFFIWGSVVGLVMLAVGFIAGKLMPGRGSDFILEVPPIRLPKIGNIMSKTLARTEWYLKEAVPLFILGTLILFTLDKLHVLRFLDMAGRPFVTGMLGLPASATKVFIMGFLRRDYGGAGLLDMYRHHLLNESDVLVGLVTITLFIPCVANFIVMGKERGWKTAFAQAAFIVPLSFIVGGIVRLLLNSGLI
ncbi:MAG: ferrous iron transport protein B [Armatimonadetes bacterium]|nr:ferrous iron transport protein B [Armatimonadota bacterium]